MKHILVKCTLIAVAALQLSVTTAMAQASGSDIPIIERELFFDNPEIAGGQLSPDGKMVSFLKAYNGILNIWVKNSMSPLRRRVR